MRRVLVPALIAAAFVLPQPARAEFQCTGAVTASFAHQSGTVLILGSWRGAYTQICNLRAVWNDNPPDVCMSWKAMADAATSPERQMTVYYLADGTCATVPSYEAAPAPYFLILL